MRMLKKAFALFLAALSCGFLGACNAGGTSGTSDSDSVPVPSESQAPADDSDSASEKDSGASETPTEDYAAVNEERAKEYAKIINANYWDKNTQLSTLTPGGGTPYLWPYTEQVSMVNGILLTMKETDEDYPFFSGYLEELLEGLRYYRVSEVRFGGVQAWENADCYLAAYGESDGTKNSYAIYNSGRNGSAKDSVSASPDGIYFDDNIWVAKEFYYAYINLGDVKYFNEAINIVNWIVGEGYEETKGLNGIYWKWSAKFAFDYKSNGGLSDDNHASLNACSSAPTAMMLAKIYRTLGEEETLKAKFSSVCDDYLSKAQNIYEFCYQTLRNSESGCIRDKIFLREGFENMTDSNRQIELIDAQELPYNTGTFMTAGAELYNISVEENKTALASVYKDRNVKAASAADRQFANTQVVQGEYSYNSNSWFTSFLLEGFIDLYDSVPECGDYIEHMRSALDYAWKNNRSDDGLVCPAWIQGWSAFNDDGIGSEGNPRQILLQAANAHCYAMLARFYSAQ